jgi:hypothetical protein
MNISGNIVVNFHNTKKHISRRERVKKIYPQMAQIDADL